ncbi:MAG: hypothetical protein Q7T61_18940 [Caulobacter sp.]|nr:hypothetical protein [Caulobacter sp.]
MTKAATTYATAALATSAAMFGEVEHQMRIAACALDAAEQVQFDAGVTECPAAEQAYVAHQEAIAAAVQTAYEFLAMPATHRADITARAKQVAQAFDGKMSPAGRFRGPKLDPQLSAAIKRSIAIAA